jgi:hypothetical protein
LMSSQSDRHMLWPAPESIRFGQAFAGLDGFVVAEWGEGARSVELCAMPQH